MDKQLQDIFAPLAEAIRQLDPGPADLMEFIAGWCDKSPRTAQAICFHARDYLNDPGQVCSYAELLVETYRRAFFDPTHLSKYDTGIKFKDDAMRKKFVEFLVTSLSMEAAQHAAGSFHESPERRQ